MANRILERDERGRIIKAALTPEEASEMGRIASERFSNRPGDVAALLAELGLSGPSAELLAQQFVRGGAGAVGAARELFRLSGRGTDMQAAPNRKPNPGTACPCCGQVYWEAPSNFLAIAERLLEVLDT